MNYALLFRYKSVIYSKTILLCNVDFAKFLIFRHVFSYLVARTPNKTYVLAPKSTPLLG